MERFSRNCLDLRYFSVDLSQSNIVRFSVFQKKKNCFLYKCVLNVFKNVVEEHNVFFHCVHF